MRIATTMPSTAMTVRDWRSGACCCAAGAAHAQSRRRGEKLAFDRSKGNCLTCHEIKGGDSPGNVGPPLIGHESRFPEPQGPGRDRLRRDQAQSADGHAAVQAKPHSDRAGNRCDRRFSLHPIAAAMREETTDEHQLRQTRPTARGALILKGAVAVGLAGFGLAGCGLRRALRRCRRQDGRRMRSSRRTRPTRSRRSTARRRRCPTRSSSTRRRSPRTARSCRLRSRTHAAECHLDRHPGAGKSVRARRRVQNSRRARSAVANRLKMAKTSKVVAVVESGGKLYSATKEVKVTVGGCGG